MKSALIDYSLYLVTDQGLASGRATVDIIREAVAGGVTCEQAREKRRSTPQFIEEARAVRHLLDTLTHRVPLIINDRIDVALAIGADGVHLGQNDMGLADTRRLAGSSLLIGISAESVADGVDRPRSAAAALRHHI